MGDDEPLWMQKERLELAKQRLEVEKRVAAAFERIAAVAEYYQKQQEKSAEMFKDLFGGNAGSKVGGDDSTIGPDGLPREQNR